MNIDELEAKYNAATPGEWRADEDPCDGHDYKTAVTLVDKGFTWIARVEHNWHEASHDERRISWKEAENNAAYIAAAHNAIPELIAAWRERDELRRIVNAYEADV